MKNLILILLLMSLSVIAQAQTIENFEFNTDNWVFPEKYQIAEFQGKQSLLIERTADDTFKGYYATVKKFNFKNGVIEFDMFCPQSEGSNVGFLFRLTTYNKEDRYELFYFRPFETNKIGAVQYMPVNNGAINWPDYNHDAYKSDGDIQWNEWVHVKADINGPKAIVYVNDKVVMTVSNLARGRTIGKVGLWLGNTTKCYYSNFKMTTDSIISGISKDGKNVYASSVEWEGTLAGYAFDKNLSTRWSSLYSDPQWIMIDLGEIQKVGGLILKWEAAYAKAYEIRVSQDSLEWTTVFSTTASDGGTDKITFDQIDTRYIMMYGTKRATIYGYSLYEFEVYENLTGIVVNNKNSPDQFVLSQNYPNPFNPTTTISYSLPQVSTVTLKVYDLVGMEVSTLIQNERKAPGNYNISFDASNLSSGVYFYKLQTEKLIKTKQMVLIK